MRDNYNDQSNNRADPSGRAPVIDAAQWRRLEQIGDLHFQSSAYSTALDYYQQLLDEVALFTVPRDQALGVLRKAVDSYLNLGQMDNAEALLDRAADLINRTTGLADPAENALQAAFFDLRRSVLYRERGRVHDGLNLAKRAFAILALTDEHAAVARLQTIMGVCYARLGRLEKAGELFADGLSTYRRIGNDLGVANLLSNLALLDRRPHNPWQRGNAESIKGRQ